MKLNSLKKPAYFNCKVLNPDGNLMFHCGDKKAKWYLDRNLAIIVIQNPLVIQLNFEPDGDGHKGDEFYLQERENICACCGTSEKLTKHHVVPYSYRKYFPENIKSHSYHDILPLCTTCHEKYEDYALEFRKRLAEEYDVPVADVGNMYSREIKEVVSAASALVRYYEHIPQERREHLLNVVRNHYDTDYVSLQMIEKAAEMKYCFKGDGFAKHSELMVNKAENLQRFVEQWRTHFIEVMQPQYLPNHWEIKRSIYRDFKYGKIGK